MQYHCVTCRKVNPTAKCPKCGQTDERAATMREFWHELAAWSDKQFGKRSPIGPLKHLAKEANETINKPNDLIEYADCLFMVFEAARMAGFNHDQLLEAAFDKLEVNKARQWPKAKDGEPIEHVRNDAH